MDEPPDEILTRGLSAVSTHTPAFPGLQCEFKAMASGMGRAYPARSVRRHSLGETSVKRMVEHTPVPGVPGWGGDARRFRGESGSGRFHWRLRPARRGTRCHLRAFSAERGSRRGGGGAEAGAEAAPRGRGRGGRDHRSDNFFSGGGGDGCRLGSAGLRVGSPGTCRARVLGSAPRRGGRGRGRGRGEPGAGRRERTEQSPRAARRGSGAGTAEAGERALLPGGAASPGCRAF